MKRINNTNKSISRNLKILINIENILIMFLYFFDMGLHLEKQNYKYLKVYLEGTHILIYKF